MSNKIYTIQEGDQLLKIAVEQGVNYIELLELNPAYQANPNLIYPGETLILSREEEEVEESAAKEKIADPAPAVIAEEGCLQGKPACQGTDVCDVLIFTDDGPEVYYVIEDEEYQTLILEEAEQMSSLSADFIELAQSAPKPESADRGAIEAHRAKKQQWLDRTYESGLLDYKSMTLEESKASKIPTEAVIRNKITNLTQRKEILSSYYSDNWLWGDDDSVKVFKDKLVADINIDINELEHLYKKEQSNNSSNAQSVSHDNLRNTRARERAFRAGVKEAILLSQDKVVYLRIAFVEEQRKTWRRVTSSPSVKEALRSKKEMKALVSALLDDVKKDIVKDAKSSHFGKLEGVVYSNSLLDEKLKEWTFKADSAASASEDARFAVSGEAQLARFCFHTDAKSLVKAREGEVDLSISAGAEFSLLEGKVEASACFPHRRGYHLYITYSDALGKDVQYPFGQFRAELKLALSCFVGATLSAESESKVEHSGGLGALVGNGMNLDVDESAGGTITVKGEGFAGAQSGGQVSGGLQWEAPENIGKDKFDSLVEIAANGNLAFGVGGGAEFSLNLTLDSFEFHCKASLVFGPGGSGGFGTKVDFTKIWPLAKVIWGALAVADYRTLQCINKDAYEFLSQAAYYFFTEPEKRLEEALGIGSRQLALWWRSQKASSLDRQARCAEAKQVAQTILDGKGQYSGMDQNQLPPETVGMLMDTLVQTFYWNSEALQEKAIVLLLTGSIGRSWRKFEEVLAHMNANGKKQVGDKALFDNLDRINAILAGDQQDNFNDWIRWLSQGEDDVQLRHLVAFNSKQGAAFQEKLPLVEQQIANLPYFYA